MIETGAGGTFDSSPPCNQNPWVGFFGFVFLSIEGDGLGVDTGIGV